VSKDKSEPAPKSERQVRNEAVAKADVQIRKAVFATVGEQELSPSETFYVLGAIITDLTKIEMETQYRMAGIGPE
jgi:hypothetical protein